MIVATRAILSHGYNRPFPSHRFRIGRAMVEWFSQRRRLRKEGGWLACIRLAIRRMIEAGRAVVKRHVNVRSRALSLKKKREYDGHFARVESDTTIAYVYDTPPASIARWFLEAAKDPDCMDQEFLSLLGSAFESGQIRVPWRYKKRVRKALLEYKLDKA